MKKLLVCAAVTAFMAGSVSAADLPPVGYIGIFKDATHATEPAANTVCPEENGTFDMYIWCLPSVRGLQYAEFAVSFPPTVSAIATVENPDVCVSLGTLETGIGVAFCDGACRLDWVWLYHVTMLSLAQIPSKIEIIPHPGLLPEPEYHFANCEVGYPIEPCINLTPLYICWPTDPGPIGVQAMSWGAIKSLY